MTRPRIRLRLWRHRLKRWALWKIAMHYQLDDLCEGCDLPITGQSSYDSEGVVLCVRCFDSMMADT